MHTLELVGLREHFPIFVVVLNCHLGGHLVRILIICFIWLQTKCPLLDSSFIANDFRKKVGLTFFLHITQYFLL